MSSTSFESEEFRRAHERRRRPRLRLPSLVYVDVDSDNGGILLNLSETGLALQAVAPFSGFNRVALRIQPPKPRKRLDLNAEITWLSESKKEAGLQFLELEDNSRIEIANWISAEGGARGPRATGDSAAPLPAQVSPVHFPEEAPAPRRKWTRSLESSPAQDAPPNQKVPSGLPSPSIASGNLPLHTAGVLREQSVDVPAQNPDARSEKIHAPTRSPNQRPADPKVFSEKIMPPAPSPSFELPHSEKAPPRRQKWSFLLGNSPAPEAPPIQKTPSEIPRRAVGSTYIERLTDAILRKNSVDVSPKNPISTHEKIQARTSSSNDQPDSSIIHSQNVSDAAQSPSIELPPPPVPSAPILPPPAAGLNIKPPSAPSAGAIAKPAETPKTFIPSTSEDFPRSGERRRLTRQRIFSLAYMEVGSDNGGMVLDLSESGLALQAFNPLIGVTRVSLRIQPPKSRKRIAATAEIIWLSDSKTEAGVQFLELTEDARMEIADWIAAEAAAPEPPSLDYSASQKTTDVTSAQVSSAQASSAPVYEGQDRNWEEWFPLFGDLDPGESTANQNAFNDSLHTSADSGTLALQLDSARSETSSGHPANDPDSSAQAPHQRAGNEKILAAAPPVSCAPVSHVRRPPLKSPASPAAVSQPFLSEQFRKSGTIAVVCTCVALVFLFLGMAISQGLLRDHSERSSAEAHALDGGVSTPASTTSASPASPVTSGKRDASSGHTASPSESAAPLTRHADAANISRASPIEVRDKHRRDNSQPRMPGGESASAAAMPPSTNVPSPDAAKSDAQNTTVPSLPVWSVQAAANHIAGTPATNAAPLRAAERRSDCYLLYRVEPLYPREAREQRIEGTVMVHLQIGTDGRVRNSRELSGPAPLVPAALAAVREWRFIPALLNGQPVDTEKDVSIEFQLSR
jgi:TonB family protein